MKFIKNYFDIRFDEKNIYYSSLTEHDFEYYKYTPIKTYQENPSIYNFLFEVQELLNNGEADIINGELVVSTATFMQKKSEENSFQYNMTLKNPVNFSLDIAQRGIINQNSFRFDYEIIEEEYKNCEIIGCFAINWKGYYLLNKNLYYLFKAIKDITNIPDNSDKGYLILKFIDEVKQQSKFTHSVLSSHYNNEEIFIPSTMSFDFKEDEFNNISIIPKMSGLSDEGQQEFFNAFQCVLSNDGAMKNDSYVINVNDKEIRIVIPPEIKENLAHIRNFPKIIRDKEVKNQLINNPMSFLPNKEVVLLENLSDRVIGFGDYNAIPTGGECYDIDWKYPSYIKLYNISGHLTEFKINNSLEQEDFAIQLKDSITNDDKFFIYNDITIPLSQENIERLKQFLTDKEKKSINSRKDLNEKILAKVELIDINNEYYSINILQETLDDLKNQIRIIRENNTNNDEDKIFNVTIGQHIFPLIPENMKELKEAFNMHLILASDDNIVNSINELTYKSYCDITIEEPKSLKKDIVLKEYQRKGLAWLQNSFKMKEVGRKGVLLADDMGLGKTLQILSFLLWLKDKKEYNEQYFDTDNKRPILIVVPVILLENWYNEYYKFFEPTLGKPLVLHGENLRRLKIEEGFEYRNKSLSSYEAKRHLDIEAIKKYNIVLTNYNTLSNYEFSFASIPWSVVVLDEAQEIKENASHKAQVVSGLIADFRIASTGTPVENSIYDLWSIFNFLQKELLGSKHNFMELIGCKKDNENIFEEEEQPFEEECELFQYEISDIENDDTLPDIIDENSYQKLRDILYYEKPYSFILRREKAGNTDLKKDLPSKTIHPLYKVPLSAKQIGIYHELKNKMNFGAPDEKLIAFMNLTKFSQHPRMISHIETESANELIAECPKLQKLINIIKEEIQPKNEKVLIFSIFHDMQKYLKIVLESEFNLDNINIINGTARNRQEIIDKFQENNNKFDILLLSPKAAGVGLNIVGANHVIHYGRWWNPAKENQATDRVYRIGQTKPVHVYYLVDTCPNEKTFDENLHELIMKKIDVAKNFLVPNNIDIQKEMQDIYIQESDL